MKQKELPQGGFFCFILIFMRLEPIKRVRRQNAKRRFGRNFCEPKAKDKLSVFLLQRIFLSFSSFKTDFCLIGYCAPIFIAKKGMHIAVQPLQIAMTNA